MFAVGLRVRGCDNDKNTGGVVIMRFVAGLVLGAVISFSGAQAATLTVDSVSGAWTNPVTTNKTWGAITGVGTDDIAWGIPWSTIDQRSTYDFDGGTPVTATTPTTFLIGSYTHENWTIYSSSDRLLQADLAVNVAGFAGGLAYSLLSAFTFTHDETLNNAACPAGTNPCGDLVTVTNTTSGSTVITVGNTIYTLIIDGFVQALGGPVVTSFLTAERQATTLYLQARLDITTIPPTPVPLPASGLVLGAALGGLYIVRRRRGA